MIAPRIGTCLFAAALLLGACGGDATDTSNVTVPAETSTTEPATTTTESTTTTTEDPKAAVEAAFYEHWDAFVEILEAPDPSNPLIDQYFTGAARSAVLDGVSRLIGDGHAVRLPADSSNFRPQIKSIVLLSDTEAIVYECTIDGLVVYDTSSGEIVNQSVDKIAQRNLLQLEDGSWKVSDLRDIEEDEPSCGDF